jgi:hypothetical protein
MGNFSKGGGVACIAMDIGQQPYVNFCNLYMAEFEKFALVGELAKKNVQLSKRSLS